MLKFLVLVPLLAACTGSISRADSVVLPSAAVVPAAEQAFRAGTEPLEAPMQSAVERLQRATGLVPLLDCAAPAQGLTTHVEYGPLSEADELGLWVPGHITIHVELDDDTQATTVLHEMLHALGVEHGPEGSGVMSPHIGGHIALSAVDLEALCSVQECTHFEPEQE